MFTEKRLNSQNTKLMKHQSDKKIFIKKRSAKGLNNINIRILFKPLLQLLCLEQKLALWVISQFYICVHELRCIQTTGWLIWLMYNGNVCAFISSKIICSKCILWFPDANVLWCYYQIYISSSNIIKSISIEL